jgi:hypothetical protein
MRAARTSAFVFGVVMAITACRPALHVSTLQLGRTLNSDSTVANITTRFKPDDGIYAAALTDQTGSSTITARWSYNGRVVSETPKKVAYKGQGATAFEFKNAGEFPVGDYKVEILVDGQPVESREFKVE